jgi:hypothetical protein
VAYVSDFEGQAMIEEPGNSPRALRPEEIIAARDGVYLRTSGGASSVRLGLADQSIVYLGPNTEIELVAIADGTRVQETVFVLSRGIMLASTDPLRNLALVVRTPIGLTARVVDSVMGVVFDDRLQRLDVDCFSDHCQLGTQTIGELPAILGSGEHGWLDAGGQFGSPDHTRNELYAFADFGGGLVATPSPAQSGGFGQPAPSRTPLGPLFVPPTSTPLPPPTKPPPEPTEKPRPPTKAPTAAPTAAPTTAVPATATRTERPSRTPTVTRTQRPSRTPTETIATTEAPTATEEDTEPPPTETEAPTEEPTAEPTEPDATPN